MITVSLILAGTALAAFAVMVAGIRRSERRHSLFTPERDGFGGRLTRAFLGLRVEYPSATVARRPASASTRQAGR